MLRKGLFFQLHEWVRHIGIFGILKILEALLSFLVSENQNSYWWNFCVWRIIFKSFLLGIVFELLKVAFEFVCSWKKRNGLFPTLSSFHWKKKKCITYRVNFHFRDNTLQTFSNHLDKINGSFKIKFYRNLSDRVEMCYNIFKHRSCHFMHTLQPGFCVVPPHTVNI